MNGPQLEWPIPPQPVVGDRGGAKAWIEAQAVRGALASLGALPEFSQRWVSGLAARACRRFDRRHSDAARRFLEQALGATLSVPERERRVLEAWQFFFRAIVRSGWLDGNAARERFHELFEIRYGPGVEAALARPRRGLIVVGPHLGDIDAGAFALARAGVSPVYVVSRPPRNRYLSIAIQRQRERRGFRLLHRHGAMEAAPKIFAANGTMVLMLDQRARRRTVVAPFFGRAAHCERGPGILMRRMRVPVAMVWCQALEGPVRYRLNFSHWFEPEQFARSSPEEIATALNRAMEELILSAPEQYFWLHDRYRKAPSAEKPRAPEPSDAGDGE